MLVGLNASCLRVVGKRGDARRIRAQSAQWRLALSTFSGLLWGGGGMMGKLFAVCGWLVLAAWGPGREQPERRLV